MFVYNYSDICCREIAKVFVFQLLTVGLGWPVELDPESVTIGYAFQIQFSTPTNISELWSHLENPLDVLDQSRGKRSIEKEHIQNYDDQMYEFQRNTELNDIDHIDSRKANNLASMRWTVYKALAEIAER